MAFSNVFCRRKTKQSLAAMAAVQKEREKFVSLSLSNSIQSTQTSDNRVGDRARRRGGHGARGRLRRGPGGAGAVGRQRGTEDSLPFVHRAEFFLLLSFFSRASKHRRERCCDYVAVESARASLLCSLSQKRKRRRREIAHRKKNEKSVTKSAGQKKTRSFFFLFALPLSLEDFDLDLNLF